MSTAVGVAVFPSRVCLPPGGRSAIVVTVTNHGDRREEFRLHAGGVAATWLSAGTPAVRLAPGATGTLALEVSVPARGLGTTGRHSIRLTIVSGSTSALVAALDVTLEVVAGTVSSTRLLPVRTILTPARLLLALAVLAGAATTALGAGLFHVLDRGWWPALPAAALGLLPGAHPPMDAPRPPAQPPRVVSFELRIPPDGRRGEFELAWEVQGADEVRIDGQPQPGAGTLRVLVSDDRRFALEAHNAAGTVAETIGLRLLRPPEIRSFQASAEAVTRGQPVTLTWDTVHASRVTVNGQPVDAGSGALEVRPERDTTYTLVAENELGRVEQRVAVQVRTPAPAPRR